MSIFPVKSSGYGDFSSVGTGIERKTLRGDFGVGSGKKHLSPQIF
jgi:hypothetical protein